MVARYFFDASALVKRYATEIGSEWVEAVCQDGEAVIVIASLSVVEVVSAIRRKARSGEMTPTTRDRSLTGLQRHLRRQYVQIHLRTGVITEASRVLAFHPLKASDAVQLASAMAAKRGRTARGRGLRFVAADGQLLEAARRSGFDVEDANVLG